MNVLKVFVDFPSKPIHACDWPGRRRGLVQVHLLLLAHNRRGEGTYLRLEGIGREMAKRGHLVTLIVVAPVPMRRVSTSAISNLKIVETSALLPNQLGGNGLDPLDILQRMRWVTQNAYDVVHASDHRPASSWPALLVRRRHGTAYVSDWADLWGAEGIVDERQVLLRTLLKPLETRHERSIHGSADGVTAISDDLFHRAVECGQSPENILLLPNGVDTDVFRPLQDERSVRLQLKLPVDAPIVGYAGLARIDMDLVWESFSILHTRIPSAKLLVIGRRWREVDRFHSIRDHVIQLGWLPLHTYAQALACADVLLLPYRDTSRNRGRWPGKMAFYLAVGKPTVANPTGDMGKLLESSRAGKAADEDPASLADGMYEVLRDRSLALSLGRRGREVAVEKLAWNVLGESLEQFYQRLRGR